MKKLFFAVSALLLLAGCQVEIDPAAMPSKATHTVKFIATDPATKTEASIDKVNGVVNYSWKATDATMNGQPDKFHVFEGSTEAEEVLAVLEDDGTMTITATFGGDYPEPGSSYTAYFNTGVQAAQSSDNSDYDQLSDVLTARTAQADAEGNIPFIFTREVSIAEMNIKGLTEGELLESVVVESLDGDKFLTGSLVDGAMVGSGRKITITTCNEINAGVATVRFVTIPVENVRLRVTVTTIDNEDNTHTFAKTFAKPISFTKGNLRTFGVTTNKSASYAQGDRTSASLTAGPAPDGSAIEFSTTYQTNKMQLTAGHHMTYTLHNYTGKKIVGLTLTMRSNTSSGAGYLSFTSGSAVLAAFGTPEAGVAFSDSRWNGSFTNEYTSVSIDLADADHTVAAGEDLVITIGATTNSLYCTGIAIDYVDGAESLRPTGLLEMPAAYSKSAISSTTSSTLSDLIKVTHMVGLDRNYTFLYDPEMYASYWVAYPLAKGHMGSCARPSDFPKDPDVDADKQTDINSKAYGTSFATANYAANLYSRGHQLPNADRNGNTEMQNQAFYATNITPQIQNGFNGGVWEHLEQAIRDAVPASDTLYIVTGAAFRKVGGSEAISSITNKNDSKVLPIPNYYWKVVLKVHRDGLDITDACAIGFWLPHDDLKGANYADYVQSVDQIESWTGFDFFANLPRSRETAAEANSSWTAFQSF